MCTETIPKVAPQIGTLGEKNTNIKEELEFESNESGGPK